MAEKKGAEGSKTGGRREVSISELQRSYSDLDDEERLSFTARLFCEGNNPSQIKKRLEQRFGGSLGREEPYRLLRLAAALGYFHYTPPIEVELSEALRAPDRFRYAAVVQTGVLDDVTERSADVLLRLIQDEWKEKRAALAARRDDVTPSDAREADTVRIGLAGGRTVERIVRALVELLKREDPVNVPPILGFHTACTGIQFHDSSTDPNAFVAHLLQVPGLEIETFSVPYQGPPVTTRELRSMLEAQEIMKDASREFTLVNVIVTSGSSWRVEDIGPTGEILPALELEGNSGSRRDARSPMYSQLKALMQRHDKKGFTRLLKAGTTGDIMWQPVSVSGTPDLDTEVKAMTLAPLSKLPGMISEGKRVLLALGPYHGGDCHKGDVLRAVLGASLTAGPLATHLVCDHRTARAAIKAAEHAPATQTR